MARFGFAMFRNWVIAPMMFAVFASSSMAQQIDTRQFAQFLQEADSFNKDDPTANLYRAGIYKGYIFGIIDMLQAQKACSPGCTCELEKALGQHLVDHPELQGLPAIKWLPAWLESRFSCNQN